MPRPTPSLWFNMQAEEAATFYCGIFPNSEIVSISRYPEGIDYPGGADVGGQVMTVDFVLDGQPFNALNGGPHFSFTEATSWIVPTVNQTETDYFWERLVDGGEPSQCGWLKDKFGMSWQIVPTRLMELLGDPDPGRSSRATQAMLQMGRIDIAAVEAAADASE